ncbi:MAG TPA: outer membrane protein assembly factor BamE [Hyphomicrobiales bacterium]|nr:outer membrane protein assembly factor BamE [Hyphomicrobiales bacterium]
MRPKASPRAAAGAFAAALALIALGGCGGSSISETHVRGYMLSENALQQIPVGSSQEQVSVVMGTPSTTASLNGDIWYYISQKTVRPVAFMNPHIVDQHVVAVYFDKNKKVTRIANYGLKDGKVFDFISRTTPTSGIEQTFLQRALGALSF